MSLELPTLRVRMMSRGITGGELLSGRDLVGILPL